MATYRQAGYEAESILQDLMSRHYPDLTEAGVTVAVLFAHAPRNETTGEPKGPALTHANWPAAALVKVNSQKDRVEGKSDATILLDGDQWPDWSDGRKAAVIDHELYHLEVQRDQEGGIKLDDANRPKLKIRPHDWQLSGFAAIAERHGQDAFEVEAARLLKDKHGQLLFPWMGEAAVA